jgi:C1A family cysteine protease
MTAKLAVFFVILFVALALAKTRAPHEVRFQEWMGKHHKQYATQEEYQIRLKNFIDNSNRALQLNMRSKALNSTATFAVNKFSDLSVEEFSSRLGMKGVKPTHSANARVAPLRTSAPPSSFDWRNKGGITGQKDEGQCGSCWAMTVAMAIESAYMIHKGVKNQPPLSTQQIVDCDTNDDGCNGGNPPTAYQYVVDAGGLETDADYPYKAQTGDSCLANKTLEIDPITGFQYAIPEGSTDEIAMANFLATNQPISTAVDASSWSLYSGGILMADQCSQNIDHGVQIVGYNGLDKNGYWVIRNMWGADWGENGFIRLQFGENTCGLTSLPTAPTL